MYIYNRPLFFSYLWVTSCVERPFLTQSACQACVTMCCTWVSLWITHWCMCSFYHAASSQYHCGSFCRKNKISPRVVHGGGGVFWSIFAGYVSLASQNPYPIIVYFVDIYRPHLSHLWPRIFLSLSPCLPEFSYPGNPENVWPHFTKSVTPL